ncbi:DedA family protein [Nonomuraea thailandensis]
MARYIPGGRTATTLTMGAVRHPLRSFTFFDLIATSSWAVYSGLIGYFGGMAFENDPIKGLLLGLGIALSITAVVEIVRWVRKQRAIKASPERLPADTSV